MTYKNNMKNIEVAETEKVNGGLIFHVRRDDSDEMRNNGASIFTIVADTKPRFYGVGC